MRATIYTCTERKQKEMELKHKTDEKIKSSKQARAMRSVQQTETKIKYNVHVDAPF